MIPDWKSFVSNIDRLFVKLFATWLYAMCVSRKGKPFGPSKHILTKEECIERIAQFMKKHSDDDHNIDECRICAKYMWEQMERREEL